MPIVKNSFERHKVLDRCFRDKSKKYFMADLVRIVNEDTFYYYGTSVSERTIRKDIAYMMDSEGYSAPIIKVWMAIAHTITIIRLIIPL